MNNWQFQGYPPHPGAQYPMQQMPILGPQQQQLQQQQLQQQQQHHSMSAIPFPMMYPGIPIHFHPPSVPSASSPAEASEAIKTPLEKKRLRNRINQAKLRVREKDKISKDRDELIALRSDIIRLNNELSAAKEKLKQYEEETPRPDPCPAKKSRKLLDDTTDNVSEITHSGDEEDLNGDDNDNDNDKALPSGNYDGSTLGL